MREKRENRDLEAEVDERQEPTPEPPPEEEEPLARAERQREEYLRSWQRAQADYQNLKRRQLADLENAVRQAQEPLLADLLLVLDYLDMALSTEVRSDDAARLAEGVGLTRDQLLRALERAGVGPIPVAGLFDPALHQAVATVDTEEAEPGTIVETVRSGWTYQGRVLRPAQVRVAARPDSSREP